MVRRKFLNLTAIVCISSFIAIFNYKRARPLAEKNGWLLKTEDLE